MESTNLVELVKNVFNQDVLNHISGQLKEDKANVEKALDGYIPAILLRLEAKTSSSRSSVLSPLVDASKKVFGKDTEIAEGIKQVLSNPEDPNSTQLLEASDGILNELFVDRLDRVDTAVVGFSGIKPSSGLRLMSVAAPATILALANHKNANGENSSEALLQLINQKEDIINSIPEGLNLATPLGLSKLSNVDQKPRIPIESDDAEQRKPHKVNVLQWILIFIIGLGILFGFYAGCGSNQLGVTTQLPKDTTISTMSQTR